MAILASLQSIANAIIEDAYANGTGWAKVSYDPLKETVVIDRTISEHIMASAKEGKLEAPKAMDIEGVARAIAERLGLDPDAMAFSGTPVFIKHNVHAIPKVGSGLRPVWTFFTTEADAAVRVLDI